MTTTTFKDAMRIVVGGTVTSARTETDRIRYYRMFLHHVMHNAAREVKEFNSPMGTVVPLSDVPAPSADQVAARIENQRRAGFDEEAMRKLEARFKRWYPVLLNERAKKAASARWKNGHIKRISKKVLGRKKSHPK